MKIQGLVLMNDGRILTFLILMLIARNSFAQIVDSTFNVSLSGDLNYLKSFQLRAELKLARSTDFCRGFTIPTPKSAWKCDRIGGGEAKCLAKFECGMIKKGFSRKSETIRLTREIRKLNMAKKKFAMVISRRPFKNINRYKLAKEVAKKRRAKLVEMKQAKADRKRQEEAILRKQIKLRSKRLKNEMTEMSEFAQLEQELDVATQKKKTDSSIANSRIETVEQMEAEALAADQVELNSSDEESGVFGEDKELAQLESEEEFLSDESEEPETVTTESTSKLKLLSFGTGMYSISDSEDNAVTTFGLLWSPLWRLNKNWHVKGNVSWHPFSAVVDINAEAESFNIIEIGADLEWRILDGGLYVSAGYAIQNWGSSVGGSFSAISLGGGYYFEERKDRLIDYIFVKQVSVSNETSNVELVGGLGFIF